MQLFFTSYFDYLKICYSFRHVSAIFASLLLFTCLQIQFSLAADTLSRGHSIRGNQTLISGGGNFELGFFTPDTPENLYLGIWYKKLPTRTVVWVANRQNPLTNSTGVLQITTDGNLSIVKGDGSTLWSTNIPVAAENPTAKLLDSGNLIVIEAGDEVSNDKKFLWQSFDYPSDTMLPDMKLGLNRKTGLNRFLTSWKTEVDPSPGTYSYKLNPGGSPQLFIYNNSIPLYRTGPWIGNKFSGTPELDPEFVFNFNFINNEEEIYYTFSYSRSSIISRLVMTESGILERFNWNEREGRWTPLWEYPRDQCDQYAQCPSFGSCNINTQPILCSCLKGFEPKSPDDWFLRDFSAGCVRRLPLNCGNGDGFLPIPNMKFPDTSAAQVDVSLSLRDCRIKCLDNCNCTAYASANINGRGHGCLIWSGELTDLRVFPSNTEKPDLYIRVNSSELSKEKPTKRVILIVTIPIIFIVLLLASCWGFLWWKKRKQNEQDGSTRAPELSLLDRKTNSKSCAPEHSDSINIVEAGNKDPELLQFDLEGIAVATDNFSNANKVGEGGFGPVYKGVLPHGQEIAVKRLSKSSGQGLEEFKNEVLLISKLQHRNLVRLLGCCLQEEEKILIYEYMSNKSLDLFLFDETRSSLLDWGKRFNIIIGTARGLLYLHHDSRLRIIHRDLKASNILLDDHLNPKIADFGMARIFGGNQTQAVTKRVVGTHGYMSPEYIMDGLFSEKSDVFSFGVLLLEIVSGKRNKCFYHSGHSSSLLGHGWNLWKEDRVLELIDPIMGDSYSTSEVLRSIQVGFLCVQEWAADRPTMSSVFFMLGSEATTLPLPKQPAFSTVRTTSEMDLSSNKHASSSLGEITVTLEEGR